MLIRWHVRQSLGAASWYICASYITKFRLDHVARYSTLASQFLPPPPASPTQNLPPPALLLHLLCSLSLFFLFYFFAFLGSFASIAFDIFSASSTSYGSFIFSGSFASSTSLPLLQSLPRPLISLLHLLTLIISLALYASSPSVFFCANSKVPEKKQVHLCLAPDGAHLTIWYRDNRRLIFTNSWVSP